MIKFLDYYITFQEVPNEIALVFTITNCQNNCKGCHSPWLRDDAGENLETAMQDIIDKYIDDITCVCFMGEGNDPISLNRCILSAKSKGLKTCLYTGAEYVSRMYELDYLKVGPYNEVLGGLDSPATNQRMLKWNERDRKYENITSWFWRKKV